eukprot:1555823-Alexandrium_andersonii.AAC.1
MRLLWRPSPRRSAGSGLMVPASGGHPSPSAPGVRLSPWAGGWSPSWFIGWPSTPTGRRVWTGR